MKRMLAEFLRELCEDEVRVLGRELGLPEGFVGRPPFPGPDLAIRCPGEIMPEKRDALRKADAIDREEIRKAGLYDTVRQAFAVILPPPLSYAGRAGGVARNRPFVALSHVDRPGPGNRARMSHAEMSPSSALHGGPSGLPPPRAHH